MDITLQNHESEICDDFEGYDEYVIISSADIYVNNKIFGSYHAAWPNEGGSKIDIVIYPFSDLDNTNQNSNMAIAVSYNIYTKEIENPDIKNFMYDSEWCEQNNVISTEDIESYSLASMALEISPLIIKTDKTISEYIDNA